MGTWGHGPFDNDEALDLVGDLKDSRRPLAEELRRVLDPFAPRGSGVLARLRRQPVVDPDDVGDAGVVAAAAVVAAALGLEVGAVEVAELLAVKPLRVDADLRVTARAALDRATGPDSEWFELWQESGGLDESQAETDRVRRALQAR